MDRKIFAVFAFCTVLLAGCAYDAGYNPYSKMDETGYQQESYSNGAWGVAFVGGYPDFCKEAAFYRSAELTYEKGHRYFKILAQEDRSTNVHTGARTTGLGGHIAGSTLYLPVYYYKIKLLEGKSEGRGVVDAYHVLNTHNLPRKAKPYSVAERKKGKFKD